MKKNDKIKVGISVGDLNGIGIEVILKTFEDSRMLEFCTPVIFASSKVVSTHKKILRIDTGIHGVDKLDKIVPNKLNLFNVWKENVEIGLGSPTEASGSYAFRSLQSAVKALKDGEIDALVTAPIDKNNMPSDKFAFKGHTEYLESEIEGDSLMILMTDELRIGLITGHVPIAEVAAKIDPELIEKKVQIMYDSLVKDFGIGKPRIAVLGLNPHCGDQGIIGSEDDEIVKPTIEKIQKSGKLVFGPYAADGFFGNSTYKKFDGVLAMYHDQGLAPFKTIAFGNGVNFTAGLKKIRTSPDHGTAFDIAGKAVADFGSFKEALFAAIELVKTRRSAQEELEENKLIVKKEPSTARARKDR